MPFRTRQTMRSGARANRSIAVNADSRGGSSHHPGLVALCEPSAMPRKSVRRVRLRSSRYGDLSRTTLPASLGRADDRCGEAVQSVFELSGADLCAPERAPSATLGLKFE